MQRGAVCARDRGEAGEGMRLGDWILCVSMVLNVAAGAAYAYQGHWRNVGYWFAVLQLNYWLMQMR